jgi:peptide/nickel transport system ATP-binding protein
VVAELADDILVMYAGRAMEYDRADKVFTAPEHPYTWGLLASMPRLDREVRERLKPIDGSPPSLINVPTGCPFNPRCPHQGRGGIPCTTVDPRLPPYVHAGVACHLPHPDRIRIFSEEVLPTL